MNFRFSPLLLVTTLVFTACSGPEGPTSLVRLDVEASGDNCATGGTAIRSGVDKNADGVLSDDEVSTTRFACNGVGDKGEAGPKALVQLDPEAPGDNCAFGGTRITVMVDNVVVGEPEYVCNAAGSDMGTTWQGDFNASSPGDMFVLQGIRHITGRLELDSHDLGNFLSLPMLERVDGDLIISGSSFTTANLPKLVDVGGDLFIQNTSVTTVSLPALVNVGGEVFLGNNHALETCDLSALARVGDRLRISDNDALVSLDLSSLAEVVKNIGVGDNEVLPRIELPALATVGTYLNTKYNPALVAIELPVLASVGEHIEIENNEALVAIELPVLASVGEHIEIENNDALVAIALPVLASVGENIEIENNEALVAIELPVLASVMGRLKIAYNPALASFAAPALTSVSGRLWFKKNGPTESTGSTVAGAADLDLSKLVSAKEVNIEENPGLRSVDLSLLERTDNSDTVGEGEPVAGHFMVISNPRLAELELPKLSSAGKDFFVLTNAELQSLTAPELRTVTGNFSVAGNPTLPWCHATDLADALEPGPSTTVTSGNDNESDVCPPQPD